MEYGWNAANKLSYIHNSDTTRRMTFSYDGGGREVTRVSSRAGTTSEKKILLMGYEQSWTQAATAGAPWQLDYTRIFINTPAGVIGMIPSNRLRRRCSLTPSTQRERSEEAFMSM